MKFTLKVFANQAQTVSKPERKPDGSVTNTTEQVSRIAARDITGNTFSFSLPYNEGKLIELDKELSITVE